jgi:hypothetical protein
LALVCLLLVLLLGSGGKILYDYWSAKTGIGPVAPVRPIPNTDVNPYGANLFLNREVEPWKIDKTLQMASEAGIGWVKLHVPWEDIEPQRKGVYLDPSTSADTWTKYERLVDACFKYDLHIVARLDRPPDWTRADNSYKERPPDDFEDYGDYVYAFVSHFRGRIQHVQIWNEPNIFPEWGNQAVDPAAYVDLLRIAYRRAKEADPNVYVLCAPLAITLGQPHPEPGQWIAMSDLDYLEAMYQAGAKDYFDIYSANAFGMDRPPEDPPAADVLNFQRVVLQRQIMERYGDRDKAVWFNEYGWNAAPADMPADALVWQRVSEQQQAEYTVRGIQLAREEWPWSGVFMIWYFRQVGSIAPDRADYYFRMVDPDFTPRLLYWAVQDVTASQASPGPGLYQETNPAVKPVGEWTAVIDPQALGQAYIRSAHAGDTVSWSFRGTGVDLHTRRGPTAGNLYVSIDGYRVNALPRDDTGQSYVLLAEPITRLQADIPLARDLHAGEHTLRLTVRAPGTEAAGVECAIDGFTVVGSGDLPFPWLAMGLVLAGVALDVWLLVRSLRRLRWLMPRA